MSLFDRRERKQEQCEHDETVTTNNFGLQRVVCLMCGKVEMHHLAQAEPGTLFRVGR